MKSAASRRPRSFVFQGGHLSIGGSVAAPGDMAHWSSEENVFCLYDTAGASTPTIFISTATPTNSTQLPNQSAGDTFIALHEAIARLADLPETNELHIDDDTRLHATRFLNLIGERDVVMPKIFPQDGEALVFTWDIGQRKRLITVAGNDVSGIDIDRRTAIRCDYDLAIDPPEMRAAWLPNIGTGPIASSVLAEE